MTSGATAGGTAGMTFGGDSGATLGSYRDVRDTVQYDTASQNRTQYDVSVQDSQTTTYDVTLGGD